MGNKRKFPSSQSRGGAKRRDGQFGDKDIANLTTPSAPVRWLRAFFSLAQPLLRLRPIGLALRVLLCEEGNV
ncbi:MAG: hypothetical protein DMG15_25875 [Acidobacteria bacterium]|nr:MAG: hypothetical protein DMG15_25875 [Acidobacteriota bacterium]